MTDAPEDTIRVDPRLHSRIANAVRHYAQFSCLRCPEPGETVPEYLRFVATQLRDEDLIHAQGIDVRSLALFRAWYGKPPE